MFCFQRPAVQEDDIRPACGRVTPAVRATSPPSRSRKPAPRLARDEATAAPAKDAAAPKKTRGKSSSRSDAQRAAPAVQGTRDVNGMCARCDKDHDTEACPAFSKPREEHPDARRGTGRSLGAPDSPGSLVVLSPLSRVVRQPGDGSCLYHSLVYGLGVHAPSGGMRLRLELADWVASHGDETISDTPLRDWVRWDSGCSPAEYAQRMRSGQSWGGAIEMAACSRARRVDIHVYERQLGGLAGFKRIASFTRPPDARGAQRPGTVREVHVLYAGGVHYDALLPANTLGWSGRL